MACKFCAAMTSPRFLTLLLCAAALAPASGRKGRPRQAADHRSRPARHRRPAQAGGGLQRQRGRRPGHDGDPRRPRRSPRAPRRPPQRHGRWAARASRRSSSKSATASTKPSKAAPSASNTTAAAMWCASPATPRCGACAAATPADEISGSVITYDNGNETFSVQGAAAAPAPRRRRGRGQWPRARRHQPPARCGRPCRPSEPKR